MDIGQGIVRKIEVDDLVDVWNVQPARGEVAGNENAVEAVAKGFQGFLAIELFHFSAEHARFDVVIGETVLQLGDLVVAVEKDQRFAVHGGEGLAQKIEAFTLLTAQEKMTDVWIEGGFAVANEKFCVSDMRSEPLARAFVDGRRAGDGLGRAAQGFLDGSELATALLREQGVDFVKNHGLDGLAVDLAAIEKLEDAARCADEDLRVFFQLFELVVDIGAAADEGEAVGRVERGVQIAHDVADLHGELLRWRAACCRFHQA